VSSHCENPPGACGECTDIVLPPTEVERQLAELQRAAREFIDAERDYVIDRTLRGDQTPTNWPIFACYLLKRDVLTRMVMIKETPDA